MTNSICPEGGEIATHPSTVPRKFQLLDTWPNSFSPQGEAGKWTLSPAHSALLWGGQQWQMPTPLFRPHHLPNCFLALCHPQEPNKCQTASALGGR